MAARIPELRRAIGLRNALIHGYGSIEDKIVWQAIETDLPGLRERASALLAELGETP